jgi:hypothetical protein
MAPENTPAKGEGNPQETGITPPRSLFAEDVPRTPPPPSDLPAAPRIAAKPFNVVTRVVLPLVVLVVGIAAIAWVAQQLPGRGSKTGPLEGKGDVRDVLSYTHNEWTDKSRGYPATYEINTSGFHDFPFQNQTGKDLDVGVAETNCQCAKVEVCAFNKEQRATFDAAVKAGHPEQAVDASTHWAPLAADKEMKQLVVVPAEGAGIIRVFWKGKTEPTSQGISVKIWSRAAGTGRDRGYTPLEIGVTYVLPVLFEVDRLDFGMLGPQQHMSRSFICYSLSRDLEVKPASKDKCVVVEVTPLRGKEFQKQAYPALAASTLGLLAWHADEGPFLAAACALATTDRLPEELKIHKRVPSAFRVTVTLYEQRDGKQMDLGHFKDDVPLAMTSGGKPIEPATSVVLPALRASIRGDVSLQGPPEEGGRINFGLFKVKEGTKKKVYIFAPKGATLTFVRCEPSLLDLDVHLKAVGDQGRWEMDVTIPPGQDASPLPEDGVIVLRCVLPAQGTTPPVTRMARIPVMGTAVQH